MVKANSSVLLNTLLRCRYTSGWASLERLPLLREISVVSTEQAAALLSVPWMPPAAPLLSPFHLRNVLATTPELYCNPTTAVGN